MPLLEIVRAEKTDDATLATAFATGKALRKSCVLVKDAPAFVVNRLPTRFLGEVTRSVDEGTLFEVADSALDPLGLPMSPFVLLQLVGPAVAFTCPRPCMTPTRTGSMSPTICGGASRPGSVACGPTTPRATGPSTPRWPRCSSKVTRR